jgi:hypothetical protein
MIQLGGRAIALSHMPVRVEGIVVNRPFTRLYILHANQYGNAGDVYDGALIGRYEVHYEDDSMETVPIVQGEDVRDWNDAGDKRDVTRGRIAWIGADACVRGSKFAFIRRLYLAVWENPHPAKKVVSIAFSSTKTTAAAPFCVAMTVEGPPAHGNKP